MSEKNAPPPLIGPKIIHSDPATSIKCVKQNVNPFPYHVHAKNQLP